MVYRPGKKGDYWFIVRQNSSSDWIIPKASVRKGESSVRTSIRIMADLGGMRAKVLEEVGRANGTITINTKAVAQKHIYYLMVQKSAGEPVGFSETQWLDYAKAVKKLSLIRDKKMLKLAREVLKKWKIDQKLRKIQPDEFE
ncbi:hypothetical protein A2627_05690 [Candidatus Woesebacteria bacterium RIFCSPHIGHO2_01_FULL_39_28]|uniref:Nudix hydrolase domain-containing protein n=1 Tax=Candidatus Woesebacteria bacterium RIFCSPHIGHO2_01_FULL_39_28 TaxID=1802496 RepID=A0A1F7YHR2_9BACT|nr:MAG: hypothetical protein A2627_05690 [Candidatus Woesebacteria bacterium RIFCSPHIGHO2_01_FULL_39_28]